MSTTQRRRSLTRADLVDLPDDGYRYELIDGELFVSGAPTSAHQRAVGQLHLHARTSPRPTCPPPPPRRRNAFIVLAWALVDGAYEQVADVTAEESWSTDLPLSVTVAPSELLA